MRNGELLAIATGNVQGVGFRATAKSIANKLRVTGFARNLPNGSVEICAQGEKTELDQFLNLLHKAFPSAKIEASFGNCSQRHAEFNIQ